MHHHPRPPAGPDQHKLPLARAPSLHSSPRSPPGVCLCPGLSDSEGWRCPELSPPCPGRGPGAQTGPSWLQHQGIPGGLRYAQRVWLGHTTGDDSSPSQLSDEGRAGARQPDWGPPPARVGLRRGVRRPGVGPVGGGATAQLNTTGHAAGRHSSL